MDFYKLLRIEIDKFGRATLGDFESKRPICAETTPSSQEEALAELGHVFSTEYNGTRDQFILTTDPLFRNLSHGSQVFPIYFGSVGNSMDGVLPNRVAKRVYKHSSKQKARSFARRLESGDIVFTPYSTGDITITEIPGFQERDIVNRHIIRYAGFIGQRVTHSRPLCRTSDSPMYVKVGPVYNQVGTSKLFGGVPSVHIFRVYERQTVATGAMMDYPSDVAPGLVPALDSFLTQLKTVKPIKGLVTEVVCEANSGAYDILTSVLENARETIPMIMSALIKILKKYQELRGSIRKVKSSSLSSGSIKSDIAQLWLQFRYAIGPLAMDVNDLLTYMDENLAQYQSYRKGRTHELAFSHAGWSGKLTAVDRCLVRNLVSFHQLSGLKINAFSTAWQLMPTSVFVDWFFNIGNVLTASISPVGLDKQRTNYSTRVSDSMVLTHPDFQGSVTVQVNAYVSSPIDTGLNIGLEFAPNLTYKRLIDAWAVIWGGVKNPLRYR